MTNPVFIYLAAWGGVLFLYSLGYTTNLVTPSDTGLLLVLMNMASILLAFILTGCTIKRHKDSNDDALFVDAVRSFTKFSIILWFVGTLLEIAHGGGFPLYWKIAGIARLYTEFGIPSFHGVMNAFYLQSLTMLMYLFVKLRQKSYLLMIALLLLWPVLLLGRGILLSGLLQIICISLLMSRISIKKIMLLVVLAMIVVVVFGVMGDMRQTSNPFMYLVHEDMKESFAGLPSGFLWFYVYLTAGLSNFFHNVDSVAPAWSFSYSFSNMLPSVVRNFLELDPRNDLFQFVDINLNTSTIYAGAISDFGPVGGFISVFLIQLFCCFTYAVSKRGRPWGMFAYTVSFQILIFSIFYDMFFLLPTLFQFAICFLMYNTYLIKKRKMRRRMAWAERQAQAAQGNAEAQSRGEAGA